jgi:hypothetical protein
MMIKFPLKPFRQSRLLQNGIGRAPGFDMTVGHKADIGDGTVPNFMIAFTLPREVAPRFTQVLLQGSGVIAH